PSMSVLYSFSCRCLLVPSWFVSVLCVLNHPATSEIYTLSLHDALPICAAARIRIAYAGRPDGARSSDRADSDGCPGPERPGRARDRKSTRLNSSHVSISYAVFCLKKKKTTRTRRLTWRRSVYPQARTKY